jgi:hypothetical protein
MRKVVVGTIGFVCVLILGSTLLFPGRASHLAAMIACVLIAWASSTFVVSRIIPAAAERLYRSIRSGDAREAGFAWRGTPLEVVAVFLVIAALVAIGLEKNRISRLPPSPLLDNTTAPSP